MHWHMGREHASREKKLPIVIFFIFAHKNVYRIRFQKIKIGPWKGFEKKAFFSLLLMRKRLSGGQKWFLKPYFPFSARTESEEKASGKIEALCNNNLSVLRKVKVKGNLTCEKNSWLSNSQFEAGNHCCKCCHQSRTQGQRLLDTLQDNLSRPDYCSAQKDAIPSPSLP